MPCQEPEIHVIEYYLASDMTLGQYLEELCFDSTYLCSAESCQRPMLMHFRSYAHGTARINVLIEEFLAPIPGFSEYTRKVVLKYLQEWKRQFWCGVFAKSVQRLPQSYQCLTAHGNSRLENFWSYYFIMMRWNASKSYAAALTSVLKAMTDVAIQYPHVTFDTLGSRTWLSASSAMKSNFSKLLPQTWRFWRTSLNWRFI